MPTRSTLRLSLALLALATSGAPAGAQSIVYSHPGPTSGVDGLGDLDLDGFGDYLVAGSDAGAPDGFVRVLSGATGTVLHELLGAPGESFGWQAGDAGDVDADGTPDFLVRVASGATRLYSGLDGGLIRELPTPLGTSYESPSDAAGDVDADGHGDVVIGDADSAFVYSGATGAVVRTYAGGPSFGQSVAGVGDVDGDGHADVAVGTPLASFKQGQVEVFSGADSTVLHTFVGDAGNVRLGWSVDGAGDGDSDGVPDVVAGAPFTGDSSQTGYVQSWSGASGAVLATHGGGGLENLGTRVSRAGDLDLDGYDDVLAATGQTYHVRGFSPQDPAPLFDLAPPPGSSFLGAWLSGVGRANHDAWPDLVVAGYGEAFVVSPVDLGLTADVAALSVSIGGTQTLDLDADAAHAGLVYFVMGSASGTSPGLAAYALVLPLNPDPYFLHTLNHLGAPPLVGPLGALDGSGDAQAAFSLAAGLAAGLDGLTLFHAYAVLDLPAATAVATSNAVPVTLMP